MSVRMALCVLVLMTMGTAGAAQDFRATISGQVTDPEGRAISGAIVKAVNLESNIGKEAQTTSEGYYTLPYLDPGIYRMEVKASGFSTALRERVILQTADKLNLPIKMELGQTTETVTVTSQELIETGSADRGLIFDPISVQELPLNGRQVFMLLELTPGVIFTQETFGASGFSGTRGWDVNSSLRINGARAGQNLFLLNGAPISNEAGTWQVSPNAEAVREFKVMTNTYDAAYGRFGGGVINVALKSGGNKFHGNLFDYWRNKIFDANSFQSNYFGRPKDFHNSHQFGGTFGGPIRKDKDFIFVAFEGWQEVVPFPNVADVPPTELRDGASFNQLNFKIFDPLTTHVCGSKPTDPRNCQGQVYVRDPFPDNKIPENRISPIGRKILSYFPSPNAPGLVDNFIGPNVGRYYYNQPMVRWDHSFSEKHKLHASWIYQHGYEFRDSTGFGRPAGSGNTDNQRRFHTLILGWTSILSPTAVLDVRGSLMRFTQITPGYNDFSLTPESLGMTQLVRSPSNPFNVSPQFTFTEYTRLFSSGNALFRGPFTQWNLSPSLTLTRGKQTIKAGFEFNYQARGIFNTGFTNLGFTSAWTQQFPGRKLNQSDGSTIASLLLGLPASGSVAYTDSSYLTRPYYAGYIQDDWRVNQRINLNLGLRYEVQVPWKERFNRANRGFDPTAKHPFSDQIIANWKKIKADYDTSYPNDKYPYPSPPEAIYGAFLFPGKDGQPERLYDTDFTTIAPRFGIAWRLSDTTVLRAGAGIYYQSLTQTGTTTGFSQSTPYVSSLDGIVPAAGLTGPYSLVNPFPNGLLAPPGATAMAGVGGGISFDPPHFRAPRTYQYTLGFQQQLGRRISVEASFAGNYQNHINITQDYNHPGMENQLKAIADPVYYTRQRALPNPFYGILPSTTSLGGSNSISAFNLLRPYPIYGGGVTNNLVQAGWYRADLLQFRLSQSSYGSERGAGGVLGWNVVYTLQKAYEANHRLNNWNTAEPIIYEIDFQDRPNSFAFSGVWDPPLGKGRRYFAKNRPVTAALGNWRLSWTYTYSSGTPVAWFDMMNVCDNNWKATYGGHKQTDERWFNNDTACYRFYPTNHVRETPDRFPDIRAHRAPQLSLGMSKSFVPREGKRVQIGLNVFNATNTPIRLSPNTDFTNPLFGKLPKSQSNFPRQMQMSAKFIF